MPRVISADQTELFVKDWGSGQPVILIHGWPLSSDTWDDQAIALAEGGYRAIAYDRRGFGRSSQPWSGYDCDRLSDDLAAVIEQTGAKDAVIVGLVEYAGAPHALFATHKERLTKDLLDFLAQ